MVPSSIATVMAHPILMVVSFFTMTILAAFVRRVPVANVFVFALVSIVSGAFIAPAVYLIQAKANAGGTFSSQPVLHALGLSTATFIGLSAYALISGRDFSAWAGFLWSGLWVLIGGGILNIFFGGEPLSLALASASVLVFTGYILYDTSEMLDKGEDDVIGCAMNLYLDFLNLFLNLLRIFGASSSSKD